MPRRSWLTPTASAVLVAVAALAARAPFLLLPFDTRFSLLSDDAYYYLEAARRWIGSGAWPSMDGRNPTNGFHPLYMGVVGAMQAAFGSDPHVAVSLALAFNLACNGLTAWLLVRAWRNSSSGSLPGAALLLAALSPGLVAHGLAGVENSLSALLLLVFALRIRARIERPDTSIARLVLDGILAGVTMLARSDSAVTVGLALLVLALARRPTRGVGRALVEPLVLGGIAAIVVAPWLLANLHRFGSIVQDSALAIRARIGALDAGPAAWFRRALLDLGFWAYRLAWAWGMIPLTGALVGRALPLDRLRGGRLDRLAVLALPILCAGAIALRPNDFWFIRSPGIAAVELLLGVAGLACGLGFVRARATRPGWFELWAAGATGALVLLYAFGFGHFQPWYTTGPTVIGILLLTGPGLGELARSHRTLAVVLVALTCVQAVSRIAGYAERGTFEGLYPNALGAGAALRSRLETLAPGDARVGSFDSGRMSYVVHPFPITNLDGVMNHAAAIGMRDHRLASYLERDGIRLILSPAARLDEFRAGGAIDAREDAAATQALGEPVLRVHDSPEGTRR